MGRQTECIFSRPQIDCDIWLLAFFGRELEFLEPDYDKAKEVDLEVIKMRGCFVVRFFGSFSEVVMLLSISNIVGLSLSALGMKSESKSLFRSPFSI